MPRSLPLLVVALAVAVPTTARAGARGVIRVGVVPIDLVTRADTPVLGTRIDDAVGAYNAAAAAYDQAHGYAPGSAMAPATIGPADLGVRATLLTIAPALEAGGEHVYVRLEGLVGFADNLRSYGAGFYPLNLAVPMHRGTLVAYVSAGGSASWLERPGTTGTLGALVTARAAIGVRFARRLTVEVGYAAYMLGALVDRARMNTMSSYDPRGSAPPPSPSSAIAGGEQRGVVDVSMGLAF